MTRQTNLPELSVSRFRDPCKGSILIITLWSLCFLSAFAVILGYQVRQKITVVKRLDERDSLRFIAEAGIKRAIVEMEKREAKTYDTLNDYWSSNVEVFKDARIGDGICNICYNYTDEKTGVTATRFGLIDEERKVSINKANPVILKRLFIITADLDEMEAQELAFSIADWRDGDSGLSIPLGSAEDSYYRNIKYPYEAKDAEFEVLEEVLLVKGMTKDIFEKVKNYITIYGDGKVNINTASKSVLLALGIGERITEMIMTLRSGKDGVPGNGDDIVFDAPGNIVPKISASYHLSDSEVAQFSAAVDQNMVVKSNFFSVRSIAGLNNKKSTTETACVIDSSGKVLYWREG
jgi:general secretion pathway protein K